MKKKLISNILFLFIINNVFGQTKIEGVLLDSISPIAFAKVYLNNRQSATLTDLNGYFEIICNLNDTLIFESNKYESKSVIIQNSTKLNVQLAPKVLELEEVSISLNKIPRTIKKYKRESNLTSATSLEPYFETAVFIENKEQERGLIKSVSVFIPFGCNTLAPFRVNLYNIDLVTGLPSTSILKRDIILKPIDQMSWLKIDFDSLRITFPENGFFFSVEALPFEGLIYEHKDSINIVNPKKLIIHEPLTLGTSVNKLDKNLFHYNRVNRESPNWSTIRVHDWNKFPNYNSKHIGLKVDLVIYSRSKIIEGNSKDIENIKEEIEVERLLNPKEVSKAFGTKLKIDNKTYPQGSIKEVLESMVKSLNSDNWQYGFIYLMSNTFSEEEKTQYLEDLVNDSQQGFNIKSERIKLANYLQSVIYQIDSYTIEIINSNEYKLCYLNGKGLYFLIIDNSWFIHNFFSIQNEK